MTPVVRYALPADVRGCAHLLRALFSQDREFEPDETLQVRGLELILAEPQTGRVLVADAGGEVVGMVSLLFSVSTVLGARVATLEDLIVREDLRGRGLGRLLLTAALERAGALGCQRITMLTDFDNSRALSFYQAYGFHRSPMVPLRKLLP